jgi:hypothetical protein
MPSAGVFPAFEKEPVTYNSEANRGLKLTLRPLNAGEWPQRGHFHPRGGLFLKQRYRAVELVALRSVARQGSSIRDAPTGTELLLGRSAESLKYRGGVRNRPFFMPGLCGQRTNDRRLKLYYAFRRYDYLVNTA